MRLIVGTLNAAARLAEAEAVWGRLVAAVGDPVPDLETTFANYEANIRDGGLAQAIPEFGPGHEDDEILRVVMPARFFDRPPDEQLLTLIHESCHVRLMRGSALERNIDTIRRQAIEQARRDTDPHGYQLAENDKYDTAKMFRTFDEEVMAERMLAESHPDYAERRAEMYLAMRRKSLNRMDSMVDELRCYGLLYEIARDDLGTAMSRTTAQRQAFNEMADQLVARLIGECADGAELITYRARLQVAAIPTGREVLAVDEVADRIMRLNLKRPEPAR